MTRGLFSFMFLKFTLPSIYTRVDTAGQRLYNYNNIVCYNLPMRRNSIFALCVHVFFMHAKLNLYFTYYTDNASALHPSSQFTRVCVTDNVEISH